MEREGFKLDPKQEKKYFCTRPALAAKLMGEGYAAVTTPNPWHERKSMWIFTVDLKAAQIIYDHLREVTPDCNVPPCIISVLYEANDPRIRAEKKRRTERAAKLAQEQAQGDTQE